MNTEDLDVIAARTQKAIAGPWIISEHGVEVQDPHGPAMPYAFLACGPTGSGVISMEGVELADAEFIAHAREDIPIMEAEIRRLHKERDDNDPIS